MALLTRRTTDSSSPWLGVPLPRPDSLKPMVTRDQKEKVLLKFDLNSKNFISDGDGSQAAVLDDVAAEVRPGKFGNGHNID